MLKMKLSLALKISLCAVFSSLAAAISLLHIEIPMPILIWLKFDFAEIPDMMAYYIGGFYIGVLTALIHMVILNLTSDFPIIGPSAKFLAVVSMMLGLKIYSMVAKSKGNPHIVNISTTLSAISMRTIIMTFYNLLIFLILLPDLLQVLPSILKPYFGYSMNVSYALIVTLILTGIFNIIHGLLTILVSNKIVEQVSKYLVK